jgi:hydrogenase maturation protease
VRILLIGVGTRRGDDAAGLLAAERLASLTWPPSVRVIACARSPLDLLDELAGADAAILIDATRSGRAPGAVHRVRGAELRPLRPASSHAIGVAEALALAATLGQVPERIELVGIEGERAEGERISPAVARGVEEACARVRTLAADMLDDDALRADRLDDDALVASRDPR